MLPLPQVKIDALLAHAARRLTATESGRALGVRKDTVLKYRRMLPPESLPRCDCGRSIMHTGQCTARATRLSIPSIAAARVVHGYAHE